VTEQEQPRARVDLADIALLLGAGLVLTGAYLIHPGLLLILVGFSGMFLLANR
jgi:hypothetical protein